MTRKLLAVFAVFISVGLAGHAAAAERLAVPGHTPANPTLIVSVPNTGMFWSQLAGTPLGSAVAEQLDQAALAPEEESRLERLEEELGFSLKPAEFATKTLNGLDLYLVEVDGILGFVMNASFVSAEIPGRVLDQVVREAKLSQGTSGGVEAGTVIDTEAAGVREVSLPAFSSYFIGQGDRILYSNDRALLQSAVADEGQVLFDSEYWSMYMSQLESAPGVAWAFGEMTDLARLAQQAEGVPIQEMTDPGSYMTAMKLRVPDEKHIILSSFMHEEGMMGAQRRYVLSAPPPGDVSALNSVPEGAIMAYGTNHFDGLALLEVITSAASRAQGSKDAGEQIKQQLSGLKMMLGFDVEMDLLANIGPNLGFALQQPDPNAPMPVPGALLVANVKNPDRFRNVLTAFGNMMESMAAPPPPAQGSKEMEMEEEAAPTPTPVPMKKTMEFQGEEIVYFEPPEGAGGPPVSPAYTLTSDDKFLIALTPGHLQSALKMASGSDGALLESAAFQNAAAHLPATRNSLTYFEPATIADLLEGQKALLTGPLNQPGMDQGLDKIIALLRSITAVASTERLQAEGKYQSVVVVMP